MLLSLLVVSALAEDGPTPDMPHPVGLLQLWGTVYDQDQDVQADPTGVGDVEDDPGIKVKEMRFGLQDSNGPLIYRISVGVSSPYDGYEAGSEGVEVVDAVMGYQIAHWFALQAGMSKVPFSRDHIMGAADLTFQERGIGSEYIAPERAMGVVGIGMAKHAKVQLGLFNSSESLYGDDSKGKTLVLRAEGDIGERDTYAFWGGPGRGAAVGVGGGGFWTDDISTRTFGANADLLFRVKGLAVMVDGAWSSISPLDTQVEAPGVLSDTTRTALTAQASYSFGIIEPSLRFSNYNDTGLGNYNQVMAGVVLHGGTNLANYDRFRVGAGYVLRLEEQDIPNDTVRMWTQVRF